MVAVLFGFFLFLFLTLLGKAVMEALSFRFAVLRSWLLAPSVGLAAVVLLTLNINQAGLPVKSFASLLAMALAVFIGVVFWWRRPVFPWKQLSPFLGAAIFSFLYTCWPMFLYGFRWYGYMNGDMSVYVLDAARMMQHGFYQIPTLQELNGTDYSQYLWFHFAPGMFRCGADVFLAWFASLVHDQPLRISMPALGAVEMAQLWSAAALVLTRTSYRRLALVTALLVAASPFFILGVMAQLLPQVGGLALLFCLCSLCMRPLQSETRWRSLLPNAVLIAAISAASCIYYPEASPFGAVAIVAYHGYLLIQRKEKVSSVAALGIPALIFLAVFARQGVFTALGTTLFSLSAEVPATPFDRVLDPSIFASLPGLEAYYGQHRDPWISISIAVGAILLLLSVWTGFRYAWKGQPAAFLLLVMLAVGVRLFSTHAAFGIFKLAMFIQPVYLFSLAAVAVRALGKRWYVAPALYLPATMAAATLYVATSTGHNFPTTLPGINSAEVRPLRLGPGGEIIVSSLNGVGAAVYAAESAGTEVKWADFNYLIVWARRFAMPPQILTIPSRLGLTRDYMTPALSLRARLNREAAASETILGHGMSGRPTEEPVSYLGHLASDPWVSSNNGHRDGSHSDNYFIFDPIETAKNFLVLITTSLGGPIGMGESVVSRWPPERDVFKSTNTFYGVGRHLLFEVIRPTPNVRLRLSLTRTLTGGGRTALPESAEVHAAANQRLDFVGSGAANITTSPLQLYERNGRFYFALDFGTSGSYFPSHKTGLLRMFNADIPLDNRQLVGFARDMALVTESQYANMERPTGITSWPAGLLSNPNLEFSGIYEDGWISNRAFVVLGKAKAGDQLHITGQIPGLPRFAASGNEIRVLLNGKCIYQRHLKPGNFEVANTISADSAENRVDFTFDQMNQLPGGDDRPISAQIFQITIKGGAPEATAHQHEPETKAKKPALLPPPGK
jgi:hypothetical protein